MTDETTEPTAADLPHGGAYSAEEHLAAQNEQVNAETGARVSPEQAKARDDKSDEATKASRTKHATA